MQKDHSFPIITINLILGYKGEPPQKICYKKGGLHVLQELPVNFHQPRLPHKKWTISYQNSLQVMWVGWQVVGSFLAWVGQPVFAVIDC